MKKIKIKENRLLIYEADKPLHDLALENTDIHLHPSEKGILLSNTTDMYSERKGITLLFSEIEPSSLNEFLNLLEELKKQDVTPIEKVVEKLEANCDENPLNVNVCNQIDLTNVENKLDTLIGINQNIFNSVDNLEGLTESVKNEIKTQSNTIGNKLTELKQKVIEGNTSLIKIYNTLKTVSSDISTLKTKADTTNEKLASIELNTDELEGKITTISQKLEQEKTILTDIKNEVKSKFTETQTLILKTNSKLDSIKSSTENKLDKVIDLLKTIATPLSSEVSSDECSCSQDTTPPSVTISDIPTLNNGDTVQIIATATDDDANLIYSWSSTCGEHLSFSDHTISNPTITATNTTTEDITCSVSVKVCDSNGNCSTETKDILIKGKSTIVWTDTGKTDCRDRKLWKEQKDNKGNKQWVNTNGKCGKDIKPKVEYIYISSFDPSTRVVKYKAVYSDKGGSPLQIARLRIRFVDHYKEFPDYTQSNFAEFINIPEPIYPMNDNTFNKFNTLYNNKLSGVKDVVWGTEKGCNITLVDEVIRGDSNGLKITKYGNETLWEYTNFFVLPNKFDYKFFSNVYIRTICKNEDGLLGGGDRNDLLYSNFDYTPKIINSVYFMNAEKIGNSGKVKLNIKYRDNIDVMIQPNEVRVKIELLDTQNNKIGELYDDQTINSKNPNLIIKVHKGKTNSGHFIIDNMLNSLGEVLKFETNEVVNLPNVDKLKITYKEVFYAYTTKSDKYSCKSIFILDNPYK